MASMMMVSANDAAYAVAETVGGSIPGFAADLNATAKRYGMRDSTCGDPAGLTDSTSYQGGPKVSAYDMAIAARNALTVPAIARWADTRTYDFTDPSGMHHELTNHDKFLPDNGFGYEGANGFKTGYTEIADHTLVATAKRNGRQCIAVILGGDRQRLHVGGVAPRRVLAEAARRDHGRAPAAGRRLAVRHPRRRPRRVHQDRGRQHRRGARGQDARPPPTTAATTPPSPRRPAATPPARRDAAHAATRARRSDRTSTCRPARSRPRSAAHHSGGLLSPLRIAFLLVILLAVGVVLRRRAVKRQRARRIARQRARAKAMRSGSLPVVDGRYRTGMRVGPPLESRVRVKRNHIDLTEDEPAPTPTAEAEPTSSASTSAQLVRADQYRLQRPKRSEATAAGADYQGIETPPLGRSIWPVMNAAASETR